MVVVKPLYLTGGRAVQRFRHSAACRVRLTETQVGRDPPAIYASETIPTEAVVSHHVDERPCA